MGRDPMAAPELSCSPTSSGIGSRRAPSHAGQRGPDLRVVFHCWVTLAAATALGAAAAIAWPALGPASRPHGSLHPSLDAIASILLNNLRVLAAPFILAAARFGATRSSRFAGDAIVATILVGNAVAVGLALGRWREALIPFVPQLPIEYLAAATAAAAWLDARRHAPARGSQLAAANAAATIGLTAAAAAIEVLLTPHAR
jgi:hypothetical protein